MKSFENKQTKVPKIDNSGMMKYSDLAILCLTAVNPQEGVNGLEMYKNFKVIDKIEKCDGEKKVTLEDADFDVLKSKVSAMKWSIMHRDISEFCEIIRTTN